MAMNLEAACVFDQLLITGRVAARQSVLDVIDVERIARETYVSAGYGVDAAGYA
jgi:hypothetical protein